MPSCCSRTTTRRSARFFKDFEDAGENAKATQGRFVDKMLVSLTVHTYIENEVMYPRVREPAARRRGRRARSYEEHHVADVLCTGASRR